MVNYDMEIIWAWQVNDIAMANYDIEMIWIWQINVMEHQ